MLATPCLCARGALLGLVRLIPGLAIRPHRRSSRLNFNGSASPSVKTAIFDATSGQSSPAGIGPPFNE